MKYFIALCLIAFASFAKADDTEIKVKVALALSKANKFETKVDQAIKNVQNLQEEVKALKKDLKDNFFAEKPCNKPDCDCGCDKSGDCSCNRKPLCSPNCSCGCQKGGKCNCKGAFLPPDMRQAPAQQPIQQFQPVFQQPLQFYQPPMRFIGGGGCRGGG